MRNSAMWPGVLAALCLGTAAHAQSGGWADKMFKGEVAKDFGTVPRGAQLSHSFTLTNIYAVKMKITHIESGCGCVTATAAKTDLAPRESTTLDVRMDAKRFVGPKTVVVKVTVGPEFVSRAELRITANSRADIVFNPGEVNFGAVAVGAKPTQTVDVEYAGPHPFKISEAVAADMPYDVSVAEKYRQTGRVGYRLTVSMKGDAAIGSHRHQIVLKTNDPTSPQVGVLVEATVQPSLTVTPAAHNLGTVVVGSMQERRVILRAAKPFRVLGVAGTGDGVDLGSGLPQTEAAVHILLFRCKAAEGAFRKEVKIRTTAQDAPAVFTFEGTGTK